MNDLIVRCTKFEAELVGNAWTQPSTQEIELKINVCNIEDIMTWLEEDGYLIDYAKEKGWIE